MPERSMDYVVLARKLRPARFADLIGQETVARILQNAVRADRVAHAFLFAGSRGVGKTSTARILTKLLNCTAPQEAEPCNACPNCVEIANNSAPDVYEIDAASNRGIDNIRELRENLKYAPVKCRYKTYIIDEAHMLTPESFNALLKTLEEPPPHVKFILATTAPHKIPETILSRCQRFDFPRIPVAVMTDYLARVTAQEGITLSRAALETIARNAAGGMRDALTAVDQAVSYAGPTVPDEQVLQILGLMDDREVLRLLGAVLDKRLDAALEAFALILTRGHDLPSVLGALLREVKDLALHQTLGGTNPYFQDHPPDTLRFYAERQGAASLDELQQLFGLFLELEGQLKLSQFPRACFEMALVKGCRVAPLVGVPELLAQARALLGGAPERRPAPAPSASGAGGVGSAATPRAAAVPDRLAGRGENGAAVGGAPAAEGSAAPVEDPRWAALMERVKQAGKKKLLHDLRRTGVAALDGEQLEIAPPDELAASVIRAELDWLSQAATELFGNPFRIRVIHDKKEGAGGQSVIERDRAAEQARRAALREAAEQDGTVQAIRRLYPQSRIEGIQLPPSERERD